MVQRSKIFERNRALGYVSNHVPCVVRYIKVRNENLVATVVGRCFHTYGCNKFALLNVSGLHPNDISCLAADTFHIYTCCDTDIYAWRRTTELKHTYRGHSKPVHTILPLGPFLLSVDEDSVMKIWNIRTEEEILEYPFSNETFQISAVVHPSTYLNKVLLGSKQGTLQLVNIHTSKLIYTFRGWNCEITVLEQAPAIDVIAIGLANGKILLHNIKYDKTLMELMQDWGSVTSISFRTDGPAVMLSGSLTGHIVLWNLEEKKPLTQLVSAHSGAVAGMKCLPNEPLMVTSSPDNSLKMWIFDMPDGGARLLRFREGHSSPPAFIRYYGSNGDNVMSAGSDSSLRIFSTQNETLNRSLGRARYKRKKKNKKSTDVDNDNPCMPPITYFNSETTCEKEWDNIAAIHLGLGIVTTWSYGKSKMGDLKLIPENLKPKTAYSINQTSATCLTLTSCGNFVVIGYSSGNVHKFNMQSGIHRGEYGSPTAHIGPVRGVGTDNLNQVVISGGHDCCIKFWSFKLGKKLLSQLVLEEAVLFFQIHKESSLLAVALEDYNVLVMDLDTRLLIRKFTAHSSQLTDMTFSPDARWLVTSSMDCTICTWDIPSAHLVDVFQVDAPCTSLTFSPTGDRLATTHVNYLGVFLWANRCVFEHVSLSPVRDLTDIPVVPLPSTAECLEPSDNISEIDDPIEDQPRLNEQISEELITLSLISSSRWQNLLNIDIVWKKNKPKHLLKKPRTAPFFLPTISSLDFQFDLNAVKDTNNEDSAHPFQFRNSATGFAKLLTDSASENDFDNAMKKLKDLSLSTISFEISALSPEGGGSLQMMRQFMKLVESVLRTNRDFELIQAYLALFLKKHGDTITSEIVLCDELQIVETSQLNSWNVLQSKLMSCLCIVESLKSM